MASGRCRFQEEEEEAKEENQEGERDGGITSFAITCESGMKRTSGLQDADSRRVIEQDENLVIRRRRGEVAGLVGKEVDEGVVHGVPLYDAHAVGALRVHAAVHASELCHSQATE